MVGTLARNVPRHRRLSRQAGAPFKRAFQRVAAAYRVVVAGLAPNWTFYANPEPKSGTGPPLPAAT